METHFENLEHAHSRVARDRVLEDFKTLARDAEDLLKATANDMSEKGKEVRLRLASTIQRAKTTCNELQEETLVVAKAAVKQADAVIRDHPYESLGVAFGIGLLIGALMARK